MRAAKIRLLSRWGFGLALLGLLVAGLARVQFDVEVLNLLPAEAPAVQSLKLYQQNFSNARELIVTVRAPNPSTAESAARAIAERLRRATNLVADTTWQPPWLEHPADAAGFIAYSWFNQPPSVFGELTNRLLLSATETLLATRDRLTTSLSPGEIARLTHDPFNLLELPTAADGPGLVEPGTDPFASTDGKFRLVFVRALDDLRDYRACREWLQQLKQRVSEASASGAIPSTAVIRYTGRPVFVSEISSGMERDINSSILGTVVLIGLLFYGAHRSWRPLLWLLVLLAAVLGLTLAIGGLLFGALNVVSAGFAAILLGLAVDYGLVLYQEYRTNPGQSAAHIRRAVAPSILWSALTTAGAFLVLNFGGLPGLGQLGTLVAIGITIAATILLFWFLPPLIGPVHGSTAPPAAAPMPSAFASSRLLAWLTLILAATACAVIRWRPPVMEHGPDALRPRRSSAYVALEEIRQEMKQEKEPLWLVVTGDNETQVANRLDAVSLTLAQAKRNGQIASYTLPASLWPHPVYQAANRSTALELAALEPSLRQTALANGFTHDSLKTTGLMLAAWKEVASQRDVYWPSNQFSRWLFSRFTAQTNGQFLALGLIYPAASPTPSLRWAETLPRDGVWLAGWELLGDAVLQVVEADLARVLLPMGALVIVCLWFAFRRLSEVVLSLMTVAGSGLALLAMMSMAGWSWNLLNLMSLPLLLGAGVDYSIHMQLALKRHNGDASLARRTIGRALLLCAATTVAGFGSLIWSSNAGLASLGKICATGMGFTFLTAAFFLPAWWNVFIGPSPSSARTPPASVTPAADGPSSLYRRDLWRVGHWAARRLNASLLAGFSRAAASLYGRFNRPRQEIVMANLLPVLDNNRARAEQVSREVFKQFAQKLIDLWRYESGRPIDDLVGDLRGWENFARAQTRGRGILILTLHLGNWELGAALLAARGIKLSVVTLDEPDSGLTELRAASRERWGIETLVIGKNPFAFVDVIRRLEAEGAVALLVDRPAAGSATTVELFGRPFLASLAAAELARATGCVLLPVYLPRVAKGYLAEVLPEIPYDRALLGSRAGRTQLTQAIVHTFEPVIRQYPDQWYHFVPIWPP